RRSVFRCRLVFRTWLRLKANCKKWEQRTLSDGCLFGLDHVVHQRFFERDDGDLELAVVRLFGGDALQPESWLNERAARFAIEMTCGEADHFVRQSGDERDENDTRAELDREMRARRNQREDRDRDRHHEEKEARAAARMKRRLLPRVLDVQF